MNGDKHMGRATWWWQLAEEKNNKKKEEQVTTMMYDCEIDKEGDSGLDQQWQQN